MVAVQSTRTPGSEPESIHNMKEDDTTLPSGRSAEVLMGIYLCYSGSVGGRRAWVSNSNA